MRRTLTITLHWTSFASLILLVAGGPIPALAWAFGIAGLTMCAAAAVNGLMNGPGPKLEGALRVAHPWLGRGMYVALGAVAALTIWTQLTGGADLSQTYFYLLAASFLHGIFHLWRHTALGDGALRRITPKTLHGML